MLGDKEAAKRVADMMELVVLARCGGHNSVTVFYSQTDAVIRPGDVDGLLGLIDHSLPAGSCFIGIFLLRAMCLETGVPLARKEKPPEIAELLRIYSPQKVI